MFEILLLIYLFPIMVIAITLGLHVAYQAGDMDCQELIQVCPMARSDAVCPFRQRAAACFCVCGS